jgi:hypothetical protein
VPGQPGPDAAEVFRVTGFILDANAHAATFLTEVPWATVAGDAAHPAWLVSYPRTSTRYGLKS